MRVLVIAPSFDILGGQAVQAARLMENLANEETVEIGFLPINPRLPGPLRKLQSIKYVRTLVTSLAYYLSLFVQVPKYDVLHIFSASYLSFLLSPTPAILVGKLFGRKLLLNYHSGEAEDHLKRWRRTAIPTIKLVDKVIVPSDYLVVVFAQFGLPAEPIFNIIETEKFHFRVRDPLRPAFLSNRNFEIHYGVDIVLRAFALIQRAIPEASLTVAGDGPERTRLRQLATELGLQQTEFLGRVDHSKAVELYDRADIFLNGSTIDNQPLSLLESMSCGLPIVTTNAGGIPYMVHNEQTAMIVKMNDHDALAADALRLLREHDLSNHLINNGLSECRKYSWQAVKDQWLRTYREMLGWVEALPPQSKTSTRESIAEG